VAAGKTGTTDNFSSAWFVGYTRELAAAVAIGDPRNPIANPLRNRSIGGRYYSQMFGGDLPAQTWSSTMRNALSGGSTAAMPPAVPGQGIQGTGQVSGVGQNQGRSGFGQSGTGQTGTGQTGFGRSNTRRRTGR
jgi:membrane peptidoglycan carboxypeptidase